MSKLKSISVIARWLAGSCLGLTAVIVLELMTPAAPSTDASAADEPVVPESLEVARYRPTPLKHYAEVLSRPLFFEDRRLPREAAVAVDDTPHQEPLRLTLEGVAIAEASRVALLRDANGNRLIQLSEGMSHNGWVLEQVAPGTAAFRRGTDTEELAVAASDENRRRRQRR